MIIFLPLAVALIGLLVYLLASNPKAVEVGRIAYFCGLLVFLFQVGGHVIGLLGK